MFEDLRSLDNDLELEADVVIVGAGAAGITLAMELRDSGLEVLLLESGAFELEPEVQELYEGRNLSFFESTLDTIRLRFFGGSTNHWNGVCRPLDPIDFEPRPWVADSGWPIRFEELRPYYEAAQRYCQLGAYGFDEAFWRARGVPAFPLESERIWTNFWMFSPPTRFGPVYRAELERAGRVRVLLHANLVEIETDEGGREVTALRLANLAGKRARARGRAYVLATGGIENARLLLQPTPRQPKGVGNAHDVVGRYFVDHPLLRSGRLLLTAAPESWRYFRRGVREQGMRIQRAFAPTAEEQRQSETVNWAIRTFLPKDSFLKSAAARSLIHLRDELRRGEWPEDLGHHVATVVRNLDDVFLYLGDWLTDFFYLDPEPFDIMLILEMPPLPDNRVRLYGERDALGLLRAELAVSLPDSLSHTIRRAHEVLGAELGRAGLGRVEFRLETEEGAWKEFTHDGLHHMGATRMHENPRKGVVDRNCRVHGLANLYVAGSSVFTTAGYANPTLTLVALAARLADHLKRELAT